MHLNHWEPMRPNSNSYMDIGMEGWSGKLDPFLERVKFWNELLQQYKLLLNV